MKLKAKSKWFFNPPFRDACGRVEIACTNEINFTMHPSARLKCKKSWLFNCINTPSWLRGMESKKFINYYSSLKFDVISVIGFIFLSSTCILYFTSYIKKANLILLWLANGQCSKLKINPVCPHVKCETTKPVCTCPDESLVAH